MSTIALLFPGQGSQYVGMAKSLYESFPLVRELFEEASDASGFDMKALCFEATIEELTKTEYAQPAILTASVAAYRAFQNEIGREPSLLAGHSLGEISALCCAGAIQFADAVRIVRQRGKFMQEAVPAGVGGMAAVSGAGHSEIEAVCRAVSDGETLVVISNYNAPEQIVISGHREALDKAGALLKAKGALLIPLKVSAPFHSPLMQPAADRLTEELSKYTFRDLSVPVISNYTAQPYKGKESIVAYLSKQIVQPVQWTASMSYLQEQGVTLAVELGPQTILRNLMKKNTQKIKTYSYDQAEDVQSLKGQLSNLGQNIPNGMDIITKCIAITVCTKNNNWDEEAYQKGVVEPYRRMRTMKEAILDENRQPSPEEIRSALDALKGIFRTKGVPVQEQAERFHEIFEETGTASFFPDFEMPY